MKCGRRPLFSASSIPLVQRGGQQRILLRSRGRSERSPRVTRDSPPVRPQTRGLRRQSYAGRRWPGCTPAESRRPLKGIVRRDGSSSPRIESRWVSSVTPSRHRRVRSRRLGFITTPPKLLLQADPKTGRAAIVARSLCCSLARCSSAGYVELSTLEGEGLQHPRVSTYVRRLQGLRVRRKASASIDIDAGRQSALPRRTPPGAVAPVSIATCATPWLHGSRRELRAVSLVRSHAPRTAPEENSCAWFTTTARACCVVQGVVARTRRSAITGATIGERRILSAAATVSQVLLQAEPLGSNPGGDQHFRIRAARRCASRRGNHAFVSGPSGAGCANCRAGARSGRRARHCQHRRLHCARAAVRFQPRDDGGVYG